MATSESNNLEIALVMKEKGNEAFKNGKFQDAVTMYTEALNNDQTQPVLFGNRAMAYLKLGKYQEAKSDCDKAIDLDSKYVKAYFRRGVAYAAMDLIDNALDDLDEVLRLHPENKDAKKEIERIEKYVPGEPYESVHVCTKRNSELPSGLKPVKITTVSHSSSPTKCRSKIKCLTEGVNATTSKKCSSASSTFDLSLNASTIEASMVNGSHRLQVAAAALNQHKNLTTLMHSLGLEKPRSAFHFLNCWRTIKGNHRLFCEYVLNIPASEYGSLIDSCVEPALITDILMAYATCGFLDHSKLIKSNTTNSSDHGMEVTDNETSSSSISNSSVDSKPMSSYKDNCQTIYDSLTKLSAMKNFKTSMIFFETSDAANMNKILNDLTLAGCVAFEDIEKLRKLYVPTFARMDKK